MLRAADTKNLPYHCNDEIRALARLSAYALANCSVAAEDLGKLSSYCRNVINQSNLPWKARLLSMCPQSDQTIGLGSRWFGTLGAGKENAKVACDGPFGRVKDLRLRYTNRRRHAPNRHGDCFHLRPEQECERQQPDRTS